MDSIDRRRGVGASSSLSSSRIPVRGTGQASDFPACACDALHQVLLIELLMIVVISGKQNITTTRIEIERHTAADRFTSDTRSGSILFGVRSTFDSTHTDSTVKVARTVMFVLSGIVCIFFNPSQFFKGKTRRRKATISLFRADILWSRR